MKIIQLYAGNSFGDLALWVDTVWKDIKEARKRYPNNVYREMKTGSKKPFLHERFDATLRTCGLENNP